MAEDFYENPILNSPYAYPGRHWELDDDGRPTQRIVEARRTAEYFSPIPDARHRKGAAQAEMLLEDQAAFAEEGENYATFQQISAIRRVVDAWRAEPDPSKWRVTPETQRLLQHWRSDAFEGLRPFFCQVEAAETAIWLAEAAPHSVQGRKFLESLETANNQSNPELFRIALKLATGAGKTTVMAMLIAWQTVNAVRHPQSKRFSTNFLIVAPGITIKDRLRVLQPNDSESYFTRRNIVPPEMRQDMAKARIVVTNYHAFQRRTKLELSRGTEALLNGRDFKVEKQETESQMLQRALGDLMGRRNIVVLNDEAHHCYREKPKEESEEDIANREERDEGEENNAAARLWINGLETVKRHLDLTAVYDLSATPFFLRGSGYKEGTLFPWTVSDFSLMDAIESGIVKLPRVPIADNSSEHAPQFRKLWDHIGKVMPQKGRAKSKVVNDPKDLPVLLTAAIDAMYEKYVEEFDRWNSVKLDVPPVFIVVCNNTATSKLIYDYLAGYFEPEKDGGRGPFRRGAKELFWNFDGETGDPLPQPRTLLIDSAQLESGEALDADFRKNFAEQIDRFKREISQREGETAGEKITDADLLREVMNTVGEPGRLGADIRCVVSVSMLTEGWDANNVTHILGVRAFGTQLLCEQVVGRALRRQSYDLNDDGRFDVEYADILGVPFDFAQSDRPAPTPKAPKKRERVYALPERAPLEIVVPRVDGYRTELPADRIGWTFDENSKLVLHQGNTAPTETNVEGIVGQGVVYTVTVGDDDRISRLVYELTAALLARYRGADNELPLTHFSGLKRAARAWLDDCLDCKGGVPKRMVLRGEYLHQACDKIRAAITRESMDREQIRAILAPFNPSTSTRYVDFTTSKENLLRTDARKSHVNWVVLDSDWEAEFCRVAENHDAVLAYVKNQGLGLEVPYMAGGRTRKYIPDFVVKLDVGGDDSVYAVVEISGFPKGDKPLKKDTMHTYWVPGVNNLGRFGRWAFVEFSDPHEMSKEFAAFVDGLRAKTPEPA